MISRVAVTVLALLLAAPAHAQWTIGQGADLVLGQGDFSGNTPGRAADSLASPVGVAIDPTTGKLFIADIGNDRVMRWGSVLSLSSGDPAEAVFGQPDFTTGGERTTRDGMDFPTDVVVDAEGRLYVADALNNRILRFDNASFRPSGSEADGVLGQADFTSKTVAVTRSGMRYPRGLAVDAQGRLWVSDQGNNRVLRFDNAATKPNGADADGILGQPDFTSSQGDTSQSGMAVPRGLWVDDDGRLWVAVTFINRIMRFDDAASKPDGATADAVLGQADYITATAETSATGMHRPSGLTMDPSGRLYVGDFYNNRVLWFNSAASKPDGGPADGVLGQLDFTSALGSTSASGMNIPWGVYFDRDTDKLWVCDGSNHRVLRFSPESPVSAGQEQTGRKPRGFTLLQNYPNPFNPVTTIEYTVPSATRLTLTVYTILGEELTTLVEGEHAPGTFTVRWDASVRPSGVYIYRLRAGQHTETRTMALVK